MPLPNHDVLQTILEVSIGIDLTDSERVGQEDDDLCQALDVFGYHQLGDDDYERFMDANRAFVVELVTEMRERVAKHLRGEG